MGPVTFARRCIEHENDGYCDFAKLIIARQFKNRKWQANLNYISAMPKDFLGFLFYLQEQLNHQPDKSINDYYEDIDKIYSKARNIQRTTDLIDGKKHT